MAKMRTCSSCDTVLPESFVAVQCPVCAVRVVSHGGELEATVSPEQDQNCKPGWSRLWNWIGKKKTDVHSAGTETTAGSYGNAPEPGDVIGDYELLAEVGGNMGLVYRAQHLLLNKVVALKLLPARALADDTLRERFQREIRVLGQLQHEHLVAASDARHVETWFLVTMDWIDGIDLLRAVHNHGKLSVADACEAIRQAALGLQYATNTAWCIAISSLPT